MNKKGYTHLTYEKRVQIKKMLEDDISPVNIAEKIGVSSSTVYREIKRNTDNKDSYSPVKSQNRYQNNLHHSGANAIMKKYPMLAKFIEDKILNENMSPEKIESYIRNNPDFFKGETVSRNTIYNAIDKGLIPGVTRENLNSQFTVMYSDGMLRIPKWALEKTGFSNGDRFLIDVSIEGRITFVKE